MSQNVQKYRNRNETRSINFTSFTGSLVSLAIASNEKLLSVDFRENVN